MFDLLLQGGEVVDGLDAIDVKQRFPETVLFNSSRRQTEAP